MSDNLSKIIAEAFEHGAVFGRSSQTGIMRQAEIYAADRIARLASTGGRVSKPGKVTYCDEACTPECCSETHNRREAVCLIDMDAS